jgi:hypothetical protein
MRSTRDNREVSVTQSKTLGDADAEASGGGPSSTTAAPSESPPTATDAPPPAPPAEVRATGAPRELGPILDEALDRMERRARGLEKPVPLPWSNVSAALGGGFWSGTLVTLVGDTGSGKTQWALQAALHAAESGLPVCYVAPDSGVDQVAARLLALKTGERWSDLYVGRTGAETLEKLRGEHAGALRGLPFHVIGTRPAPDQNPDITAICRRMRELYPQDQPGTRPVLVVLDFVLLGGGAADRDELKDTIGRAAAEGRRAARDLGVVVLLVSTTSRETRPDFDDSIGFQRERRQPAMLGRGNPARLVRSGKETGGGERESDTLLVLAQEPWKGKPQAAKWTKVWCAVARNRAGSRAWCAQRFDGTRFDEDPDEAGPVPPLEAQEDVGHEEPHSREEE